VALAETLVQHFDGEGDLNDHLDAEIRVFVILLFKFN
jgi:hypothetical protein